MADKTFNVQNTGGGMLTGSVSAVASPFSIVSGGTYSLGAGLSQSVTIRYSPSAGGSHNDNLTFTGGGGALRPVSGQAFTGNIGAALQAWRLTYFGSIDNIGDGADLNDFDHDGLVNIIEFAFGLNPETNSAGLLPRPQRSGNNFVVSFTEPTGVSGISYGAEWSQTLQAADWTPVADTGNTGASPPQHTFSVPIGTKPQLYMRLKVTSP
jgi:hypothetical protein